MASTGAAQFESATNDAAVGTVAWTNPGNAEGEPNDSRATAAIALEQTNYLKFLNPAANYAAPVPTGSTIDGIEVAIERSKTGGIVVDTIVRLVKGGTVVGDNLASATEWPGTDTVATYGGPTELWGETWTAANVNAGDFGVVLSCEETADIGSSARVDAGTLTVYYTEPPPAVAMVAPRRQSRRVFNLRRM